MMPALPSDKRPRKYQRPRPAIDLPPVRLTGVLDQLRERLRLYTTACEQRRPLVQPAPARSVTKQTLMNFRNPPKPDSERR